MRRLPLKKVAAELGVSVAVVSAWENGIRFPSAHHLQQLSTYTGFSVCQLLYDGGTEDCHVVNPAACAESIPRNVEKDSRSGRN